MWSLTDQAIQNCAIEPTTRFRKDHCRSRRRRVPNTAHHVTGARVTRRSARLNSTALPRRVRELSAAPSSTGRTTASSSPMLAMRSTSPAAMMPRDRPTPYYLPSSYPSTPHLYGNSNGNAIDLPPTSDANDSTPPFYHGHVTHNNINNNNMSSSSSSSTSSPRPFSYHSQIPSPAMNTNMNTNTNTNTSIHNRQPPAPITHNTTTTTIPTASHPHIQGVLRQPLLLGENLFYSSTSSNNDDDGVEDGYFSVMAPPTNWNGDGDGDLGERWSEGRGGPYFLP